MVDAQFVTVRYMFYNVHPSRDINFLMPADFKNSNTRVTIIQTNHSSRTDV